MVDCRSRALRVVYLLLVLGYPIFERRCRGALPPVWVRASPSVGSLLRSHLQVCVVVVYISHVLFYIVWE